MRKTVFLVSVGCVVVFSLCGGAEPISLISSGDDWRYRKGTNEPAADWATAADAALDGSWLTGRGGFGYGDGDDVTVLSDMQNAYSTVYIRRTFEITEALDPNLVLNLRVDWDDGFVAFLNGIELERRNVPGTPGTAVPFDVFADPPNHEAGTPVTFELGAAASLLPPGVYVLAVQGVNDSLDSSDLSLIVDLFLDLPPEPPLVAHSDEWYYKKGTNAPVEGWQTNAVVTLGPEWLMGPGGFGYGDGDDATVLSDMGGNYTTVYIRRTFDVVEPLPGGMNLLLEMDWDDGFVAYLDGVEVARSANVSGAAGSEIDYLATATSTREASGGGSGAQPPQIFDLGPANALLVGSHTLAIIGLNESLGSSDLSLIADLRVGEVPVGLSGVISVDTVWTVEESPYTIVGALTVASGVTLTIDPGVTVELGSGVDLVVDGRLLAEGTEEARILFGRSGSSAWGKIDLVGGNLESRIAYADISGSSGNVDASGTFLYLNNVVFTNTSSQLVDVTSTSINIRNSVFPTISGELLHFSNMPTDGYAIIDGNIFGTTAGYNDVIDFTGGNRPGPIVQFLNNIFTSGVDDFLDMDGTDAHIEGNIFMNVHQDDPSRSSTANAIATGESGGNTAELTIARNIFYDCDHALLLKQRASAVFQNNTIVRIREIETASQPPAFINFGEPHRGVVGGAGALLDGNIVWELNGNSPILNFTNGVMNLEINHSIIQGTNWPGIGNSSADPMFTSLADITYVNIREKLALLAGSPAIGTGPNGLDMGALVPAGASISGEPAPVTSNDSATLTISGPGIVAFKYRVNDGPYSEEIPIADLLAGEPLTLSGLTNGTYVVSVIGMNSAGYYQDLADATVSRTWTVDAANPDRDGDGMPNDWEVANMLDPEDPADADLDADLDGVSNRDEYRAQTDPRDPESFLKVSSVSVSGGEVTVRFNAVAGLTYTVQYRDSVESGMWSTLASVPAQASTGEVVLTDSSPAADQRYYRLVTPQL